MSKKKNGAQKPSLPQTLLAALVGMVAVKVATYAVTTAWRLATREDPPQVDSPAPAHKKALWVGLVGAVTGASRQAVRDLIRPPGPPA